MEGWSEYCVIPLVTVAVLAVLSWRAGREFFGQERLPMQWGLDGKVTWTAPRRVALWFTPVLSALVMAGIAAPLVLAKVPPKPHGAVTLALVAGGFLFAHALHLHLLKRHFRAKG